MEERLKILERRVTLIAQAMVLIEKKISDLNEKLEYSDAINEIEDTATGH